MKKVWICLMIVAILAGLCACSGSQKPSGTVTSNDESVGGSPRGTVTDNGEPEEPAAQPEAEAAEPAEDAEEPAAEEPEEPAAEEPEEPAEDEEEAADEDFDIGTTSGGTYENSFIGIGCTLDENWTFASEEEVMAQNGVWEELIDDEDLVEQLSSAATLMDMYASADDGLLTINVTLENIGVLYGMTMDEDEYADAGLATLDDTIAATGMFSDYSFEKSTVMLAGRERTAIRGHELMEIEGVDEGVDIYQTQAVIKAGNYMAIITLTSFTEDVTDILASYFYALD